MAASGHPFEPDAETSGRDLTSDATGTGAGRRAALHRRRHRRRKSIRGRGSHTLVTPVRLGPADFQEKPMGRPIRAGIAAAGTVRRRHSNSSGYCEPQPYWRLALSETLRSLCPS